jgi:16S rRNA (cytosine967-C5)-methyltransferase
MTPEGRAAAAIELLGALAAQPRRPADAIAHEYFRARRYIGGTDRRAVSALAWGVVREQARLAWWVQRVGLPASPRALLLAFVALVQNRDPVALFASGGYGPNPLDATETAAAAQLAGAALIDPAMPESVRLNLPDWAFPGMAARFGERLAEEADAMQSEAPLDLRVNLLRGSRESALAALAGEGIIAEPTRYSPWGMRLPKREPIMATRAYTTGLIEVQDEGSQLIAALVGARPGMRVADLCAGAAGKTLAMAMTMQNKGKLLACDVSAPRLAGAAKRLVRAGVDNAETHLLLPGDRWAKRRAGSFDRVLVDAPCTGSGTWRRNPDARARTTATDLAELRDKQHDILAMTADLTRPGGLLVYATCSLLPEEDEDQVARFAAEHPGFETVPLATAWEAAGLPGAPPGDGPNLLMTPARHGTDGFFAAVLRRA